jgi:excisionase family DNA binding protein
MITIDQNQLRVLITHAVNEAIEPHLRMLVKAPTMQPVYTVEEAKELLGISKRTLQHLRDSKSIGFVQRGRKILFRAADIEEYLQNHRVSRRKVA